MLRAAHLALLLCSLCKRASTSAWHPRTVQTIQPSPQPLPPPQVNWWNAPAFDLMLVYPATGPEQTRDTARMRLCSPTTLSMGWCKTEHTRESEVLDYAKVKWSYYSF